MRDLRIGGAAADVASVVVSRRLKHNGARRYIAVVHDLQEKGYAATSEPDHGESGPYSQTESERRETQLIFSLVFTEA